MPDGSFGNELSPILGQEISVKSAVAVTPSKLDDGDLHDEDTTFYKSDLRDAKARKLTAKIVRDVTVKTEGVGGTKHYIDVETLKLNSEKRILGFFTKEFATKEEAENTAKLFARLRNEGYPVPPTTRYYEKDGKFFLLLTDMTGGGKYPVWTNSGETTDRIKAIDKLKDIKPTEDEINLQLDDLVNRLTRSGYKVSCDAYALRRVNGQLELFLLDINPTEMPNLGENSISYLKQINNIHAQAFKDTVSRCLLQNTDLE